MKNEKKFEVAGRILAAMLVNPESHSGDRVELTKRAIDWTDAIAAHYDRQRAAQIYHARVDSIRRREESRARREAAKALLDKAKQEIEAEHEAALKAAESEAIGPPPEPLFR